MKEIFILNAGLRREIGKQVKQLREADKLPAVLYGHNIKNVNLVLNYNDFEKTLKQVGESTLIDLKIGGGKPVKVMIHDIQRNPVSHRIIHADLYQVRMDEKIKTEVELVFVNQAPAVKDLGGILVKALDRVEIECLPSDSISHIEVDLSTLKTFDDIIRLKDLQISEKVKVLTDLETAVALVEKPRKIEEEKPEEEEKPAGEEGKEEEAKEEKGEENKKEETQESKKEEAEKK